MKKDPASLFTTDIQREAARFLPRAISDYERLDRDGSPHAERAREILDTWWGAMPHSTRHEVRSKFVSKERSVHFGAFWEIYLHNDLRSRGFDVDVRIGDVAPHPVPDFRVLDSPKRRAIQIEATAALGDDAVDPKDRVRVNQLYDAINRIETRSFLLHVDMRKAGPATPGRRLYRKIDRWLETLDPDQELERQAGGASPPSHEIRDGGWIVRLRAIPLKSYLRTRGDLRVIGSSFEGFGVIDLESEDLDTMRPVDEISPLVKSLRDKAKHGYQTDGEPLVIALMAAGEFVGDEDIAAALDVFWANRDGSPRNRGVSAVLMGTELSPRAPEFGNLSLWASPWTPPPFPDGESPWPVRTLASA